MAKNRKEKNKVDGRNCRVRRNGGQRANGCLDFGVLEDRKLMAQIFWENRAEFDLGANTAAARAIIDQVLLDWGSVISSFNYRNVGQSGWADSTVYMLTIDVDDLSDYKDGTTLAYCSADEFDGDGKPYEGSMVVGSNVNWWYDSSPAEDSEFNTSIPNFVGPFRMFAGSGNLSGQTDLYSVILHEMGHGLGFSSNTDAAWHNRINSNDYFVFNDNTTAKLERESSDPSKPPAHTGTTEYPNDLMNPGFEGNERRTISALDARILGEGYGYTINERQVDKRSFITTLDSANRTLTVWGDLGTLYNYLQKEDTINLNQASDYTYITVNGITKSFLTSSFDTITVRSRSAASWDVVNVQATIAGKVLNIEGGTGHNRVYLSPEGKNLSAIQGNIVVYETDEGKAGEFGTTELFFYDENNDAGNIFRMSDSHVAVGFGASERLIQFGGYLNPEQNIDKLNFRGGSGRFGTNSFFVDNKGAAQTYTYIRSGNGNDYVSITSLGARGGEIEGWNGTDTVSVGDLANFNVGMNNIRGPLKIDNAGGRTNLTLDDSKDKSVSGDVRIHNNRITGLGPATVSFHSAVPGGIRSLTVLASNSSGSGGNKITVFGTPQNRNNNLVMNLSTGRNNDKVFVQGTGGKLNIKGENGQDTVNVGKAGKVEGIYGIVSVENATGTTILNIDNSADTSPKSFLVSPDAVVVGSSFIFYNELQLKRLGVFLGAITSNAIVNGTPQNATGTLQTWLSFGAGDDTVKVRGTVGSLLKIDGGGGRNTVNIGNQGKLEGIQGDISIFNGSPGGVVDVNVDASNDAFGRFAKIEAGRVRDLSTGEIRFDQNTLNSLVVWGSDFVNRFDILDTPQNQWNDARVTLYSGKGNDTVNVRRNNSHTTINGQNGSDLVSVGDAGNMQGITKPLVITNASSYSAIHLDDSADTQGRFVTLDVIGTLDGIFGIVEGLSPGNIWFKRGDLRRLNIWGTSQLDFFQVNSTAKSGVSGGSPTTIFAGGGADTVRVLRTNGDLVVDLSGGNNYVTVGGNNSTAGSLSSLNGKVSISGDSEYNNNFLDIVDYSSTGSYVYQVETGRMFRTNLNGGARTADIDYSQYPLDGLELVGANSFNINTHNIFEIHGTPNSDPAVPHGGVNIKGGVGTDFAYVFGTGTGQLDINLGGGIVQYAFLGDATHSLDAIRSDVHVSGNGFIDAYVSDVMSTAPHFARFDRVANQQALDRYLLGAVNTLVNKFQFQFDGAGRLNYKAGSVTEEGRYNQIDVVGIAANTEIVADGGPDREIFTSMFGTNVGNQAGPVTFNGSVSDADQAYYLDEFKASSSQYSLRTNPGNSSGLIVSSLGSPTVTFNGMTQLIQYTPSIGGNTTRVASVPESLFLVIVAGNGDELTFGSDTTEQAGNMENVRGTLQVSGYSQDGTVTLTLDDSGNISTARDVSIVDYQGQYPWSVITGLTGNSSMLIRDHENWNVNILGSALDDSIVMRGSPLAANYSIDGGAGNDVLIGSGRNRLFGGFGRDLLVAGGLASVLDGGADEDILIGGSLNDTSTTNLNDIRDLWTNPDLNYDSRVSILLDHLLTEDKVTGNDSLDSLTGGTDALDLFFGGQALDLEEAEQVVPLT